MRRIDSDSIRIASSLETIDEGESRAKNEIIKNEIAVLCFSEVNSFSRNSEVAFIPSCQETKQFFEP